MRRAPSSSVIVVRNSGTSAVTLALSNTIECALSPTSPGPSSGSNAAIVSEAETRGREELATLDPWRGKADAVLIDAPCSGTGTWRRNPEARWRLDPAELERFAGTQAHLLDVAAELVRPGGRLVYVTCSLLDAEGADRIAAFLESRPDWRSSPPVLPLGRQRGSGVRLTPFHDGTDGFFIARLEKPC